jgi:hypothetical protein
MESFIGLNDNMSNTTEFTFTRSDLESENINLIGGKVKKSKKNIPKVISESATPVSNSLDNLSLTPPGPNQIGGGFFCSDDFTTILLECFCDNRPDVACYLLCKSSKSPKDITKKDKTDRNLLHYMSIYASFGNMVIHISKLLRKSSKSKNKSALKSKDKLGNTPLHYAAELGYDNLVKIFIESGGDPTIRNKEGQFIEENKEENNEGELGKPIDVSIIIATENGSENGAAINNITRSILKSSKQVEQKSNRPEEENNMFSETCDYGTDHFIDEVKKILDSHDKIDVTKEDYDNVIVNKYDDEVYEDDDNVTVTDSVTISQNVKPKSVPSGMVNLPNTDSDTIETDNIIQQIMANSGSNKGQSVRAPSVRAPSVIPQTMPSVRAPSVRAPSVRAPSVRAPSVIPQTMPSVRAPSSRVNNLLSDNRDNYQIKAQPSVNTNSDVRTDSVINNILSKVNNKSGVLSDRSAGLSADTDRILNTILATQKGGGKKKSSKKHKKSSSKSKVSRLSRHERHVSTYSEVSLDDAVKSDASDISQIARQISRQSSEIHERAILKIIELLKLDKTKEKDLNLARMYKAAIYKTVKEKNPLLNNFDRAVEMEKSITKETLKSIDIDKVSKEIQKHLSEKSASTASSASSTITKSATKSASSSVTLPSKSTTQSEVKSEKKTKTTKKATQKRIPEYNMNTNNNVFSITSTLTSDTGSDSQSISFSTVSAF